MALQGGYNVTAIAVPSSATGMASVGLSSATGMASVGLSSREQWIQHAVRKTEVPFNSISWYKAQLEDLLKNPRRLQEFTLAKLLNEADRKAEAQRLFQQHKAGGIGWSPEDMERVLDSLETVEIGNAEPRQLYGDSILEQMNRLSGDLPQLRDSWKSSLRFLRELSRQSEGISRPIQDKRKVNRYPNSGRKLLSQSGEGPRVEVSERPAPGGLTTLDCEACGFSTRDITLVWLRNGEPRPQETRQGAVLFNGNGTYHTGATIDIDPRIKDKYTCRVERPSLPGGLSVDWEPKSNAQPSVRVSVPLIVGVVLLVAGTLLPLPPK